MLILMMMAFQFFSFVQFSLPWFCAMNIQRKQPDKWVSKSDKRLQWFKRRAQMTRVKSSIVTWHTLMEQVVEKWAGYKSTVRETTLLKGVITLSGVESIIEETKTRSCVSGRITKLSWKMLHLIKNEIYFKFSLETYFILLRSTFQSEPVPYYDACIRSWIWVRTTSHVIYKSDHQLQHGWY